MSCDFTYSPLGRSGIGVIQPQSGLDYPFVQPSEDVRYLLADFYLAFDDSGEYAAAVAPAVPPFRIQYLYQIGCTANSLPAGAPQPRNETEADIVVVDSLGRAIFDSTLGVNDYSEIEWSANYKIYEWLAPAGVCRLVAYTTWAQTDGDARQYAKYLAPANAILDPRAVYKMPRRVLSLSVRQGSGPVVRGPYRGKFVFKNGYNTVLTAEAPTTENFVVNTNIGFSAEAGTGRGYYPICGDVINEETQENIPQPIIKINGVNGTPTGNFLIVGKDCIYARRPTTAVTTCEEYPNPEGGEPLIACSQGVAPATYADLQLGTDCPPCCECADYVDTALYMNKVYANYKKISDYTTDIKREHESNIRRWAERAGCAAANPLKLALVAQNCPYVDVVAMICNPCDECLPETNLTLNLTTGGLPAELMCGYTELAGAGKNKSAVIGISNDDPERVLVRFGMPVINAYGSAYLKFRLKFEPGRPQVISGKLTGELQEVAFANEPKFILTGCANGVYGSRVKAEATATVSLRCNEDGVTTRPC